MARWYDAYKARQRVQVLTIHTGRNGWVMSWQKALVVMKTRAGYPVISFVKYPDTHRVVRTKGDIRPLPSKKSV